MARALAALGTDVPISALVDRVCRPLDWEGRRVRALKPWSEDDRLLLKTISRGEFAVGGLRNRDLLPLLFPQASTLPPSSGDSIQRESRESCGCFVPTGLFAKWRGRIGICLPRGERRRRWRFSPTSRSLSHTLRRPVLESLRKTKTLTRHGT